MVHIDENGFTCESETYYIVLKEDEPLRTCKSKNIIIVVMFSAAIDHPRFDKNKDVKFSKKNRILSFVTKEPVKRSSVNRVACIVETKEMTSVDRDILRSFFD